MRRRLLATYLAVTIGVLVVLLVPLGTTYRGREVDDARATLQRQAFLVAAFSEDTLEQPPPVDREALLEAIERVPLDRGDRLALFDRTDVAVGRVGAPGPDVQPLAARARRTGSTVSRERDGRLDLAVPVASSGRVYGAVVLSRSLRGVDDRTRRYRWQLAAIGLTALVVVVGSGVVLARSVARPLGDLGDAARALGEGDLRVRARTDAGPVEVRELAVELNRTADRLADLLRAEAAFVGDASHELRTPLTALRLRLENLAADAAEPADADLEAALAEVERLSRLVDGLLVLARTDRPTDHAEAVELTAALGARVDSWAALAGELEVAVALEPGPAVSARITPDHLAQIVDNLVANALDACGPGGHVTLSATRAGSRAVVHVVDDGRGLPEADRRRAFDRFWRAPRDDADTATLGGSGLGLAIVARLAARNGGTVRLDEAPGGGIDAVLDLPGASAGSATGPA